MSNSSKFTEEGELDGVEGQFLGRAIVKLEIRMESVEIKVTSLTKIIRLLQHYSQKKDLQYEKETHNMEIFNSRLSKIDSMETKLGQTLSRFDELTKHFHLHSNKIDQLHKQSKDKQAVLQQLEDKTNFQISEVTRKLNSLESTLLRTIREDNKAHSPLPDLNAQNYKFEELSFRMTELESSFQTQNVKVRLKLEKLLPKIRKQVIQDDDSYGLAPDKGRKSKSKSKRSKKDGELSSVRRLKSK